MLALLIDTMPDLQKFFHNRVALVSLSIATIALWILLNPYFGIRHDGVLYLGQALTFLNAEIARDFFFRSGSQNDFSLFGNIYAKLIGVLGIATASKVGVVCSQIAFLVASAMLIGMLAGYRFAFIGIVSLAAFPRAYGGNDTFAIAELFFTGRSIAEPLCIFAFVAALRAKWVISWVLVFVASLFHPLIALPTALVLWGFACIAQPKLLFLAVLGCFPFVLGALSIAPFELIYATYDPIWWDILVERSGPIVLPGMWNLSTHWGVFFFDVAVLVQGAYLLGGAPKRFLKSIIFIGLSMVVASLVATEWMQNVFLTSIQVWRVRWIMHLVALLLAPWIIYVLWGDKKNESLKSVAIFWLLALVGQKYLGGALAAWLALSIYIFGGDAIKKSILIRQAMYVAVGFIIILLFVRAISNIASTAAHLEIAADGLDLVFAALSVYPISLVFCLVIIVIFMRLQKPALLAVAASAFLIIAAGNWDRRSEWRKFLESHSPAVPTEFSVHLGPNAQVFWDAELIATWVFAKTPSYFTPHQAASVAFNRVVAMEVDKRMKAAAAITFQSEICSIYSGFAARSCDHGVEVYEDLCKADNGPTHFVSSTKFAKSTEHVFEREFSDEMKSVRRLYLYNCANFK